MYDEKPEEYPEDWGPVYLSAASRAIMLNWYAQAKKRREGKRKQGPHRKDRVHKDISDDEGEEQPVAWAKTALNLTPATKAIAIKWNRSARARLQRKRGKGAGRREVDEDESSVGEGGGGGKTFSTINIIRFLNSLFSNKVVLDFL